MSIKKDPVWSLDANSSIALSGAQKMFETMSNVDAVAGSITYDKLSRKRLNELLFKKLPFLNDESLADYLKGKEIFEPMSGYGRNILEFKVMQPSRITCVDINHLAIDKLLKDNFA